MKSIINDNNCQILNPLEKYLIVENNNFRYNANINKSNFYGGVGNAKIFYGMCATDFTGRNNHFIFQDNPALQTTHFRIFFTIKTKISILNE